MIKKKISNLELSSLTYFITRAFLIGVTFNSLIYSTKQDSWIIPLISIPIGIIFILLINCIIKYKPNLDINEKINKLFKGFGLVIIIVITSILFLACTLNFLNLNTFIKNSFLTRTPLLALIFLFSIATLYVVRMGLNTISRTSNILFYISIILMVIIIIGLLPNIDIDNLKPFLNLKNENYLKGINTFYAFHICPIFLLTIIPLKKIENSKIKKAISISYIIASISVFFYLLITISSFGYKLSMLYEYPLFNILKHISITGFTARVESLLIIQLIFDFFICHILLIYFISMNLKYITKANNINIWYIIISICIILSTLFFSRYKIYLDELLKFEIPIVTSIVSTFIIILICIKIKMSKN